MPMLFPPSNLISLPLVVTLTQEPKTGGDAPAVPVAPGTGSVQTPGGPTPNQAAPPACGGSETFLYLALFMGLMYFMVLRPEQKRRKEQVNLLSSIKKGDRVVTVGGMHGVVIELAEKTVVLRVDAVQMTFDRVAISRVERDDAAAATGPKA
jgi:preprotein translocase subunit YajC